MDNKKRSRLEQCLGFRKTGESFLDVASVESNPFFMLFNYDAEKLCELLTDGKVEFAIADSIRRQAVSVGSEQAVVIYKGMLDAIFKIAARIVETGALIQLNENFRKSMKTPQHAQTARALLDETADFSWDETEYPWIKKREQQVIFMFSSNLLYRLVILHELGHLWHNHGERNELIDSINIDEMFGNSQAGSIESQARELIADNFAFDHLFAFTSFNLESQRFDEIGRFLFTNLVPDKYELAVFCLQMAFVYFYFMDSESWRARSPSEWTHPPHPFRLQALYMAFLADGFGSIEKEHREQVFKRGVQLGDSTIERIFGTPNNLKWLSEMGQNSYKEHFEMLHKHLPRWTNIERIAW
ncbi:hypothetical protein GJ700_02995 [Duganella sp. FT92W]|uniref:Uncharacterized protein n=1 Tax=Pseudoduganella rivuli TaxID=2666085 RepID=A0A7X2IIY0_9BURK|nr:hypothetical protein [Pseudoduganella rivuli]MRV70685.1 hypothetical protein [Pseudoduganella rivuli]